jgi:hypothetical protein
VAEGITPTSDGYSGVAVVTVLDAADRAIREQRTVRIPQVLSDAGPVAVERRSMLGVAP